MTTQKKKNCRKKKMKKIKNGASVPIECVHLQTKPTTPVRSFFFFFFNSKTIYSFIIFYLFVCLFFWFSQLPNLTNPSPPPFPPLSVAPLGGDANLPPPESSSSPAANSSSASDHSHSMISSRDPDALFSGGGISFLAGVRTVKFSYGYSSLKGKRATMEDYFETRISDVNGQMVAFFGVFDGHGGARTAEYLKNNLFKNLVSHDDFISDTKKAIVECFKQTDEEYLIEERGQPKNAGSTASTALLVGDKLIVANVGDSRVVASRNGSAVPLSNDHKPDRSDERQRIEDAGGFIIWAGTWRVGGILAVSRAFGDKQLKPYVIAEPEIQEEDISTVEFIVIASDGLWNVLSNKDAVSIARDISDAETAARKLVQEAYARGSCDNITCIVVRFEVS